MFGAGLNLTGEFGIVCHERRHLFSEVVEDSGYISTIFNQCYLPPSPPSARTISLSTLCLLFIFFFLLLKTPSLISGEF